MSAIVSSINVEKLSHPASNRPRITLRAVNCVHSSTKPIPIMTAPHRVQMPARKILGPILRVRIVAPGWKRVYVMKKTRVAMFWVLMSAPTFPLMRSERMWVDLRSEWPGCPQPSAVPPSYLRSQHCHRRKSALVSHHPPSQKP